MIHIMAHVQVEDVNRFWEMFNTRGAELRRKFGSIGAQVYKDTDRPGEVRILFRWESRDAFNRFLNDGEVKETMRAAGTKGQPFFAYLEHLGNIPA